MNGIVRVRRALRTRGVGSRAQSARNVARRSRDRKVCRRQRLLREEGKRGAISPGAVGLSVEMETLEACRICRLCGNHSEISINIFDKKAAIIDKIHAVLPISVHEMDMLPKQMCHRCSYKLEEFHKFYFQCIKTDDNLKSQLSWMRKEKNVDKIVSPMVHFGNFKIKSEPVDSDCLEEVAQFKRTRLTKNAITTFSSQSCCRCYHGRDCAKLRLHSSQKDEILVSKDAENSRLSRLGKTVNLNKKATETSTTKINTDSSEESLKSSEIEPSPNEDTVFKRLRNPLSRNPAGSFERRPNLRSRGNSVGFVPNKKKLFKAPRTQSEESRGLAEVEPEKMEMTGESVSRALRPRKTNVSSFQPSRKRPRPMDSRKPKRFKQNQTSITIKQEVEYPGATLPLDKSKENRLNKDDTRVIKSKVKIESNARIVNKEGRNKGESVEPAFSAARLMRSQVVRLRNGKAKLRREEVIGTRNLRERGDKPVARLRLQKDTGGIKIKQFCDRCNVSYINKRHKCSAV